MGWISRKTFQETQRAYEAQQRASEREVQARLDGKSRSEIRRLERESVEAARRLNQAMTKR